MQGLVRLLSQLPVATGSGLYPEWLRAAKKRTPVCTQLTHKDTGSTSCSCRRTLLKRRSQLALALAGPGSMISLFGKLQWKNSGGDGGQRLCPGELLCPLQDRKRQTAAVTAPELHLRSNDIATPDSDMKLGEIHPTERILSSAHCGSSHSETTGAETTPAAQRIRVEAVTCSFIGTITSYFLQRPVCHWPYVATLQQVSNCKYTVAWK